MAAAREIDLGQNGGAPPSAYVRHGECDATRGQIARELGTIGRKLDDLCGAVTSLRTVIADLVVPRVDELGRVVERTDEQIDRVEREARDRELESAREECRDLRSQIASGRKTEHRAQARRIGWQVSLGVGILGAIADLIARALGY